MSQSPEIAQLLTACGVSQIIIDGIVYKAEQLGHITYRIFGDIAVHHMNDIYNSNRRVPVTIEGHHKSCGVFIKALNLSTGSAGNSIDVELIRAPS